MPAQAEGMDLAGQVLAQRAVPGDVDGDGHAPSVEGRGGVDEQVQALLLHQASHRQQPQA